VKIISVLIVLKLQTIQALGTSKNLKPALVAGFAVNRKSRDRVYDSFAQ